MSDRAHPYDTKPPVSPRCLLDCPLSVKGTIL